MATKMSKEISFHEYEEAFCQDNIYSNIRHQPTSSAPRGEGPALPPRANPEASECCPVPTPRRTDPHPGSNHEETMTGESADNTYITPVPQPCQGTGHCRRRPLCIATVGVIVALSVVSIVLAGYLVHVNSRLENRTLETGSQNNVSFQSEGPAICCSCPAGWFQNGTNCYITGKNRKSFNESKEFCRELGAFIACPRQQDDNNFLKAALKACNYKRGFWLGLMRDRKCYADKTELNYMDWADGQPVSAEDCVAMLHTENFSWVTKSCDIVLRPLCEKRCTEN